MALRPQLVGVGPLIPSIQDDLTLSYPVAGLLGSLPIACMGLFAFAAPPVVSRLGTSRAMVAAMVILGAGGVARSLVVGAPDLIALTLVVGLGMGLAGALLPTAVRAWFPGTERLATGLYGGGIQVGAALSAAIGVPIAQAAGSWRWSLLAFSVVPFVALALWVAGRGARSSSPPVAASAGAARPRGTGLLLIVVFAAAGTVYYGINAWLPSAYLEFGWGPGPTGALLGVLNVTQIPAALSAGYLATRIGLGRLIGAYAALVLVAVCGLVLAPGLGFLFVVLYGLGNGSIFTLMLAVPLELGRVASEVTRATAMMLGWGYLITAASPVVLGIVRDQLGEFSIALWLLVAVAALQLVVAVEVARRLRGS
ncbi:CynX/NimT family MFS transporter [Egibacter rhizosphaerae]|nr:MFS transporter [Egibacter rhizosphaerae]